jgi:hypothetical protein
MDPSTYEFYLLIFVLIFMVWYAGFEGTLRLFRFIDLQLQYAVVRIKIWRIKKRYEKELKLPLKNLKKILEENKHVP